MEEVLSFEAVRVLGALVEKQLSTPEYYPLTLNSLRTACNQKSNRSPVVSFSELDIMRALDELRGRRLVGHASSTGSRSEKFRHALTEALHLSEAECAVIACLALRGAQTIGEIRGRTGRLHAFTDLTDVESTLAGLGERESPLVVQVPRGPGQKEARFTHLLSGAPDPEEQPVFETPGTGTGVSNEVDGSVKEELDRLREDLARLREEFDNFRKQFD